ncbi:hypothetical protein E5288_WYG013054 [Bos mutus]|uniref:Uncharacterized protein n=1 Tax=Bos mutus TaxID=72004 RepID=A0A6B0R9S2_9CETA|nr:hypothetical protein [Bos mutus]
MLRQILLVECDEPCSVGGYLACSFTLLYFTFHGAERFPKVIQDQVIHFINSLVAFGGKCGKSLLHRVHRISPVLSKCSIVCSMMPSEVELQILTFPLDFVLFGRRRLTDIAKIVLIVMSPVLQCDAYSVRPMHRAVRHLTGHRSKRSMRSSR